MKVFLSMLFLNSIMMSAVYVFASSEKEKLAAKLNQLQQKNSSVSFKDSPKDLIHSNSKQHF